MLRRTLEAYTFLRPDSCFIYDERIPSLEGDASGGQQEQPKQQQKQQPKQQAKQQQQKGQRRLLDAPGAPRALQAKGGAAGKKGGKEQQQPKRQQQQQQQQQQQRKGGARPDGGTPPEPPVGSYSAALLGALRSESSVAAREAVRGLKAEVMNHNAMVAAAFMAATEAQYSVQERAADAAAWAARAAARAADAHDPGRVAFWGGAASGPRR